MKRNKKARTKVVVRRLPPTLSRSDFVGLIDSLFGDRYGWASFRPGRIGSPRARPYSRAYIDFKRPEDVLDFQGFFDGHVFVNEKCAHFKAIVEYAPAQRVPRPCPRDYRDGTIYIDPDYLEFLKLIAKPVDNLQKPAVQLEATAVEQAEEIPVVTPLMEFVRQKRAGHGCQDLSGIRKIGGKTHKASKGKLASVTINHEQAKTKNALEDSKKDDGAWDNSENNKRNPKQGKKNVLPLKGKEVEVSEGGMSSSINSTFLITSKRSNLLESREKVIQTICLNNETRQSYSNVPPKKIKPKILDSQKQQPQHSDLESSVTCNVPKYVKKTTGDQFGSKEHHAADNIHEKPVKHKEVIGVRSRSINGENLPPSTGRNISCQEDGSKRYVGHHRPNTKNEYYRRKDNDFINRTDKRVWVQKSSSDTGK